MTGSALRELCKNRSEPSDAATKQSPPRTNYIHGAYMYTYRLITRYIHICIPVHITGPKAAFGSLSKARHVSDRPAGAG